MIYRYKTVIDDINKYKIIYKYTKSLISKKYITDFECRNINDDVKEATACCGKIFRELIENLKLFLEFLSKDVLMFYIINELHLESLSGRDFELIINTLEEYIHIIGSTINKDFSTKLKEYVDFAREEGYKTWEFYFNRRMNSEIENATLTIEIKSNDMGIPDEARSRASSFDYGDSVYMKFKIDPFNILKYYNLYIKKVCVKVLDKYREMSKEYGRKNFWIGMEKPLIQKQLVTFMNKIRRSSC